MNPSIQVGPQRYLDLRSPSKEDIRIEDIARCLAATTRFRGIFGFYSVAQHSVYVAQRAAQYHPDAYLWGLLHDASEAYVCDIPSPAKYLPEFQGVSAVFDRLDEAICAQLSVPRSEEIDKAVKRADLDLLFLERDALREAENWPEESWDIEHLHPGGDIKDLDPDYFAWGFNKAQFAFLVAMLNHKQGRV